MHAAHLPFTLLVLCMMPTTIHGDRLSSPDDTANESFGSSVSLSGNAALCAAPGSKSAFLFHSLGTAASPTKLTSPDNYESSSFGFSVSLSNTTALVGDGAANTAYVFRNLQSPTMTTRLSQLAGDMLDAFGYSVRLSGGIALVGAPGAHSTYLYRNVDTSTGTVFPHATLTTSLPTSGSSTNGFGHSLSISGTSCLVGAPGESGAAGGDVGSVYLYRNLDMANGSVTEAARLHPSVRKMDQEFGRTVSLSGNMALVGASGYFSPYIAYLFRNLDSASGTITESAQIEIQSSDHSGGLSVSLSGDTAVIGCVPRSVSQAGSAYLFTNLSQSTGIITPNLRLYSSPMESGDRFGCSVSLEGRRFLIGANQEASGRGAAYTGDLDAFTRLDTGNISHEISGVSFETKDNWIIGETTSGNSVTVASGNAASFGAASAGKAVYIGKDPGSNNNTLILSGKLDLKSHVLYIGSTGGNSGNTLRLEDASTLLFGPDGSIRMAPGNALMLKGDYTDFTKLNFHLGFGSHGKLQFWIGSSWKKLDYFEVRESITISYEEGYTTIRINAKTKKPVISSPGSAKGKVGKEFYYRISAENLPSSYDAKNLPRWLSIDRISGTFFGTPKKTGTFEIVVVAKNSVGKDKRKVSITIEEETTRPVLKVKKPSELEVVTSSESYKIKGDARDNISPVTIRYKIAKPGNKKFSAVKTVKLRGSSKSKPWSIRIKLPKTGTWKIRLQVVDAAGNVSRAKHVTIAKIRIPE